MEADHRSLVGDGKDLSFITVTIQDAEGNPVPVADNAVTMEVTGSGKLLGLCSADPGSHEDPTTNQMKTLNSLLLGIVQSETCPGRITVRASSLGLSTGTINLDTR